MDRLVAIELPTSPAFVDELRRCWDDGDAVLPVDPRLPAPARDALYDELRPSIRVDADGRHLVAGGVPVAPDDALVVATSGTTGRPKGVVHTHRSVAASARITSAGLNVDPATDHWLCCLPVAHIGGLSVVTRALLTDTPLTTSGVIDVESLASAAEAGATLVSLVVAALHRADASKWRKIMVGGSAMPSDLAPNVVRTYGMTETGSGVVYDGRALDGVSLRVSGGEIEMQTPTLARAYRTARSGPVGLPLDVADGWFRTGDGGELRADGTLTVSGRLGDVIVTGGEKVWPLPVETAIAMIRGVNEVHVVATPDDRWGQAVTAVVVATDPAAPPTLGAIRDSVKVTLPAYAAPTRLVVIGAEAIPRTPSGKVRRAELAQLVE